MHFNSSLPPQLANRSFLSTREGSACCLFQPSFHPPSPDFLRSSVHAGDAPKNPFSPSLSLFFYCATPILHAAVPRVMLQRRSRCRTTCLGRQQRFVVERASAAATAGTILLRVPQ
jgi:hypothetical protein